MHEEVTPEIIETMENPIIDTDGNGKSDLMKKEEKKSSLEPALIRKGYRLVDKVRLKSNKDKVHFDQKVRLLGNMANNLLKEADLVNEKFKQAYQDNNFAGIKATSRVTLDQIPRDFFEKLAVEGLNEKWKGKKYTHSHKDKLEEMVGKFRYVQKVINHVLDAPNDSKRVEIKKQDKKFENLRTLMSLSFATSPKNVDKALNSNTQKIKGSFKRISRTSISSLGEVAKHKTELYDSFIGNTIGSYEENERQVSKIRKRIDNIYADFAKSEKYKEMYEMKKQGLAKNNELFHMQLRSIRRKTQLEDYFLDGSDMNQLPSGILHTPLIKYRKDEPVTT